MNDDPALTDVTAIFDHYRVSARSIWNTAFWPDPTLREWDFIDAFSDIQRILFDSLVLSKIDMEFSAEDLFRKPIPFIRISPAAGQCSIMIQNPRGPQMTGYWDDPVNRISANNSEMQFIDFFDWSMMAVRDFHYYRASITKFDEHPHLVGREALIESQYVKVLFSGE
jgi:hypothetical protein